MRQYTVETKLVPPQPRFESWDPNDQPLVVIPESITAELAVGNVNTLAVLLAELYCAAFNAQNVRLWGANPIATTAWDEAPWTTDSATAQLSTELSGSEARCIVAYAQLPSSTRVPIGFILSQKVQLAALADVAGSTEISQTIFRRTGNPSSLLLWEDVATRNLRTPNNQTVRGVGRSLYLAMAALSDEIGTPSIARTSPGSFSPRILPAAGFQPFRRPTIFDGHDSRRYWLARKTK